MSELSKGVADMSGRPVLLFVVNVDWFFVSHRLPLAVAARDKGLMVKVAAADTGMSEKIRDYGFDFIPLPISRSGTGFWQEIKTVWCLYKVYRKLDPDVIHHVTIKPVLYGSIAARLLGSIPIVNAVSGLGYTFTDSKRATGLRQLTTALYRLAFSHPKCKVIFQNPDDIAAFQTMHLVKDHQTVLIRGSGVDCSLFRPTSEPSGPPLVVLATRMLWDKGVQEYVDAVRLLRERGISARFALVGSSDEGNPTAVPVHQLQAWHADGIVEWWGHVDDMPRVFAESSVVVLPSYREGLPKVLLEAAASGRAIVATDVPGCREIVRHEENGLLVPAQDPKALADAIERLLMDRDLRHKFGRRGRKIVESEFSVELVVRQTLDVYAELLGDKWPGNPD